jgi:hypothetical protein
MRKFVVTAVCVALVGAFGVPSAHAVSVIHCGTTLKQSLKLDRNLLNCTGSGFIVGANNITIDLNGFTIGGDSKAGGVGVYLPDGSKKVTVTNGTITKFDDGVRVVGPGSRGNLFDGLSLVGNRLAGARFNDTSTNQIVKSVMKSNHAGGVLVVSGNRSLISKNEITDHPAVSVKGDANRVDRNQITNTRSSKIASAIRIVGDGNSVTRNSVVGGSNAVSVAGDKNLIDRNTLARGVKSGVAVRGNANQIQRNDIGSFGARGIWLLKSDAGEKDNVVQDNDIEKNKLDGVLSDSRTTRLVNNDASTNGGDGFDVNGDHSFLEGNDADHNRGWGVDASVTGIQGSDNDVSKNGHSCRPARLCA